MRIQLPLAVVVLGVVAGSIPSAAQNEMKVTRYKYVVVRRDLGSTGTQQQQTFTEYTYVAPDGRTLQETKNPQRKTQTRTLYDPTAKTATTIDVTHGKAERRLVEDTGPMEGSTTQRLGAMKIQGLLCNGYENRINGMTIISWTFHDAVSGAPLNAKFVFKRANGDEWEQDLIQVQSDYSVPASFFEIPAGMPVFEIPSHMITKPF